MASRTDSSRTAQQRWTTRQLLEWIAGYLGERGIDNPRLTAELLVAHVIDCERLRLYMEVDRPASPEELSRLRSLVKRVAGHEPVQYVTGEAWFYGRPFGVDRSTLIPRPSTESLIERVINIARAEAVQPSQFLDIGTGTGVIAITLASELSSSRIVATDVDDAILDLAARNAARHGVDERVEFRTGPVYEPVEADDLPPQTDKPVPEARRARLDGNPPVDRGRSQVVSNILASGPLHPIWFWMASKCHESTNDHSMPRPDHRNRSITVVNGLVVEAIVIW